VERRAEMARIEPIPIRQWPPEMRDALAAMDPPEPRHPKLSPAGRPKALNLLGTFAHHTALAHAFLTFNGHLIRATTLFERQRELLVLRVAARLNCPYEWAQHVAMAGVAGLTEEEIARAGADELSSDWCALDAGLLRAVDELVTGGVIADDTWKLLAAELDAQQLLDVIYTVGAYQTLAWMVRSLEVPVDDDLLEFLPSDSDG
jgi:alkylhydroperoxidase family enzyme